MTRHACPFILTASVFLAACSGETTNTSDDEVVDENVSTPPSREREQAPSTPYVAGESNDPPVGRSGAAYAGGEHPPQRQK
jgi:hypothetical protein